MNATILNACGKFLAEARGKIRSRSGITSGIWNAISAAVNSLDPTRYPHDLPSHPLRLQEKYKKYIDQGYHQLIHKGNKNSNATKRTPLLDNLIISLYCDKKLPFGLWVLDDYLQFISGNKMIVDQDTAVIYDRADFYDQARGKYINISESTVWNILNEPIYKPKIDRLRNNRIDHITQKTPHNHRHSPNCSMAKISMDDRTFSRKTAEGLWLNAYVAYEVASQCVLSTVYSTDSMATKHVRECFREMYRTIHDNGLMWPAEVEVENHLMRGIEDDLNAMFTFVTFCPPGMGRSKRAEHFHRGKKYGDEKRNHQGIGRWYGKGAYKIKSNKKDEDQKQPRIPVETLIADDKESILRHHNALHPDQKKYPGMTRWQVLIETMHPSLNEPQESKLFQYLGELTDTSISHNDYCAVQYSKYAIDDLEKTLSQLKPNNYSVKAYYVTQLDGSIDEVYLYQDGRFITRAVKIVKYNESKLERTPLDEQIRANQDKRQAHFRKFEKDGLASIARNLVVETSEPQLYENIVVETVQLPDTDAQGNNAEVEQWMNEYKHPLVRERSITDI